jgi:hypothetical protein
MSAWGTADRDNDDAADRFGDLFAATKPAQRVGKALEKKDVEEYTGQIQAAPYTRWPSAGWTNRDLQLGGNSCKREHCGSTPLW